MTINVDWKFVISLLLTLVAAAVPIWLWQADLEAKSAKFEIISLTALNPDIAQSVDGLKLTIDNLPVLNPYLTVVELTNDGSRPILQSDFESPIEISVQGPTKIVRTKITDVSPKGIKPIISNSAQSIAIQPLLLNPEDKIQITIISSDGKPDLITRARISGISKLQIKSLTEATKSDRKLWVRATIGFLLLVIYFGACMHLALSLSLYKKGEPITMLAGSVIGIGAFLLMQPLLDVYQFGNAQLALILMIAGLLTLPYYSTKYNNYTDKMKKAKNGSIS